MNENIKVSIIMPVWKEAKYIERSIESVISQTFSSWELIIIDDGLYDKAKDRVKSFIQKDKRIIFFKNESNLGLQKTLNKGLREAKGEYIARIDDDDEWIDKNKLKKQIEFLDQNKDYGLVGVSGIIVVDDNHDELFRYSLPETDNKIRDKILYKNCFVHSSVLFRLDLVKNLGMYEESDDTMHIEDYALWLKIGLKSKFCNVSGFGIQYMLSSNSISSVNKKKQFKKNIKLIKKYNKKYPNYLISVFLNAIKLYFLILLNLIPAVVKNKVIKIYKEL